MLYSFQDALNDAMWHRVHVNLEANLLSLTLEHDDCDAFRCVISSPATDTHRHTLAVTSLSYMLDPDNAQQDATLQSQPGFIGCMRDVEINGDFIIPANKLQNQQVRDVQFYGDFVITRVGKAREQAGVTVFVKLFIFSIFYSCVFQFILSYTCYDVIPLLFTCM